MNDAEIRQALSRAAEANPEAFVLCLHGGIEFDQGRYSEAEQLLQAALTHPSIISPELVNSFAMQILLNSEAGLFLKQGINSWNPEATRTPDGRPIDRAGVEALKGRVRPRLRDYLRLGLPPGHMIHVVVALAWIVGDRERAVALAREGVVRSPGDGDLQARLDMMEAALGNPATMLRWARRLEQNRANNPEVPLWRFRAYARWSELQPPGPDAPSRELPADPFAW
jgi:hypothetical protein